MKKYDFLIVGAGLYGATFANLASQHGKKVLVIDKRNHVAGNAYTEIIEGIMVHKYGPHIFHTSDKKIWDFITAFGEFNNFINTPIAKYHNEIYNLPFNMNTFTKIWNDVENPYDAFKKINLEKKEVLGKPINLEEQAISLVGRTIYEKLIKEYTEKQWNRDCKELPAFIISRLPIRYTYNNNYYDDIYQGIPKKGYTELINNMLNNIEVKLDTNYLNNQDYYKSIANVIVYTGALDEYFNYSLGKLQWRSLKFVTKILNCDNYQGNAVVNYTSHDVKYTRIIEHKHFDNCCTSKKTIITYEYPINYNVNREKFYPINDSKNEILATKYKELTKKEKNVIFGGRLANYQYYDMDDVIKKAFEDYEELNNEN